MIMYRFRRERPPILVTIAALSLPVIISVANGSESALASESGTASGRRPIEQLVIVVSPTPQPSPSATSTLTGVSTPTQSPTETSTVTAKATPTATATAPPTVTATITPTATATTTASATATARATATPTATLSLAPTPTATPTLPAPTPTVSATATPVVPGPGRERCRTPGFWGTHACPEVPTTLASTCEKSGSQNITQQVIDAAGGCLEICGERITNTALDSADSALEAICVNVAGVSERQLARQLTAAALNCVMSGGGSSCAGVSIEPFFAECNRVCAGTAGTLTVEECIDAIDCWNNGGHPQADGGCRSDGEDCHQAPLCNPSLGLCFTEAAPAGSSSACGKAKRVTRSCTVIEANSQKSPANEQGCAFGIKEAEESCACDHDVCIAGTPLVAGCDACVAQVCAAYPSCCATTWAPECIDAMTDACGVSCGSQP